MEIVPTPTLVVFVNHVHFTLRVMDMIVTTPEHTVTKWAVFVMNVSKLKLEVNVHHVQMDILAMELFARK